MASQTATLQRPGSIDSSPKLSRQELIRLLNEDLGREYQAIIAYVVYSQTLKGAAYMNIAGELARHAQEELQHAVTLAKLIDYLGGQPTVTPNAVAEHTESEEMLQQDLSYENETIQNYRQRIRQAESLGEYAIAEQLRGILVQEQEHQIDLAMALGKDVVDVSDASQRA